MKAYHFGMIPEKKSPLGTIAKIAIVAGLVYAGYKYLEKKKEEKEFDAEITAETDAMNLEFDCEVQEADDFATKVKEAAKRVKNLL